MTPQEFKKRWGTLGASLIIAKAVDDIILSEPLQEQLLKIATDLRNMLCEVI